jgi:ABC-type multidrug transport system ATPase subunit
MDDPVSALDATLRKNIFLEVFNGLCKDKTRILATHAVDFLHLSDRVVIMDDGRISAQGKFEDLKESNPILKKILDAYYDNQKELLDEAESTFDPMAPIDINTIELKGIKSQAVQRPAPLFQRSNSMTAALAADSPAAFNKRMMKQEM